MTVPLRVQGVEKAFDGPVLRGLDLEVRPGELVAVLGPSGCGKTTLLRLVAGFERIDAGTIEVGGRVVAASGTHVPPERRQIGVVPQEGALFPHLSVQANVGFGLPRAARRTRVAELLELVGLPHLGNRMPHELSGGQQQRVALARALAPAPALVLLDEPFSALDAGLRSQLRAHVRSTLEWAGAAALLVTHDQQEALSTADVVAVVRDGRVVQAAPPEQVYARPVDVGVAAFVGEAIVLTGVADGQRVQSALGELEALGGYRGPVDVVVRPEQVVIVSGGAGAVRATVLQRSYFGHDALVRLSLVDGTEVTARTSGQMLPAVGSAVMVLCRGPVVTFPTSR